LIRELAAYEKLSHEAHPIPSQLETQMRSEASPPVGAFLAQTAEGTYAGFALFYYKYSTFLTGWGIHLEDLFVLPAHRRQGIGRALMSAVAREAVASGCRRLELSVLDWNRPAIDFYERLGAVSLDDWTTFRFTGDALRDLSRTATGP
jgi:diamine N-acetyltransferase